MGKGVHLKRLEPKEPNLIKSHTDCWQWFARVGWHRFCLKFHGSNYGVDHAFANNFNGNVAGVGDLTL